MVVSNAIALAYTTGVVLSLTAASLNPAMIFLKEYRVRIPSLYRSR